MRVVRVVSLEAKFHCVSEAGLLRPVLKSVVEVSRETCFWCLTTAAAMRRAILLMISDFQASLLHTDRFEIMICACL